MTFLTPNKPHLLRAWDPASWRRKLVSQLPVYADYKHLQEVERKLSMAPPLVIPFEIESLKQRLAEAAQGKAFLLQGGDCAERFADCNKTVITNKLKILLQMSVILLYGLQKPIIRVGRIAGQYAKPRSSDIETRNGMSLPSYRGDSVNHPEFSAEAREPDPALLLKAYGFSAQTLNYLRAMAQHGFANLEHPEYWDLEGASPSPLKEKYHTLLDDIKNAVDFIKSIAANPHPDLKRVDFYTSHEALLLPYEQALTHRYEQRFYNLSTHFPWVGMRTAQLDSAHVEYLRGIANPIAVKIGPNMNPLWLSELVNKLNPENEPGRLTLIHRIGADAIQQQLPELIEAVQATKKIVLWSSDPMHGNTEITASGLKTRHFDKILKELRLAFGIHAHAGTYLGGIHFELTGDNVTECIGGARGLTIEDLACAYESLIDPRLNYEQALEMAILILDLAVPKGL
ncbi:MAG: 3-deoxy-7-phosphoheptulonate synthase [Gammaproteobacteria bacterium]|jgi:3-deoxy-7-phosphoheptulonate synthase|nr:3-deoxy-7-phosphoheptulonate synthase [Gammaproteobacteria bacterium]